MSAIDRIEQALRRHRNDQMLLDGRDFDEAEHDANDAALADLRALVEAAKGIPRRMHPTDGPYLYLNVRDADELARALARVLEEQR